MERYIEKFDGRKFDVVVVGGGITGACVAYEAASRGLTVALFERDDFGGATSAATSKLIHGGLRYLNYLEFGLVRESLRERRILEDIAPNLVYPLPFLIPNYGKLKSNKWLIKAGMILYDLLSFDKSWTRHKSKKLPRHSSASRDEVLRMVPVLPEEGLTGGSIYYDCQSIFPERLTLAFVKSAVHNGACVSNYAEVVGLEKDGERVRYARIKDRLTRKEHRIEADVFINSGGPWAENIVEHVAGKRTTHVVRMSEGIHLIAPPIAEKYALVLLTRGGRHFFAIPWRGKSLFGTTDRDYTGNPDEYRVTRASIEQFIEEINGAFGRTLLRYSDVIYAYGGLRPLTDTHTQSSYKSSRRYEIIDEAREGLPGLITVEGGKYTTSRNLAESVLAVVARKLKRKLPPSVTGQRPLSGSEIESLTDFLSSRSDQYPDFAAGTLEVLAKYYGTEMDAVIQIARSDPRHAEVLNEDGELLAGAVYAARFEMARTCLDTLQRRTGVGTLGLPAPGVIEKVADVMQRELGWTDMRRDEEIRTAVETLSLPVDR